MALTEVRLARGNRRNEAKLVRHPDGRCFGTAHVEARASFPNRGEDAARAGLTGQAVVRLSVDNHGGDCYLRFCGPVGSMDVSVLLSGVDGLLLAEMIERALEVR